MPLRLVTPPASEPVSLEEAKGHLRVEHMQEDTHIRGLITSAREWIEQYLGRALITQTWELAVDEFPDELVLAKGRLAAVTAVTYYDDAGDLQTLDPSAYQVDDFGEPGRVLPASGTSWPDTQAGRVNAVRVRFVAGYGAASAVPQPIKSAMLLLVGHLYEHREQEILGTISTTLKFSVESLLSPYRLRWVG